MASYTIKRRRERFTDAVRGLDFELVEAGGKNGLEISTRILDAQAAAKGDRIEGGPLLDLFAYVLSVSIVDDSDQSSLDTLFGSKAVKTITITYTDATPTVQTFSGFVSKVEPSQIEHNQPNAWDVTIQRTSAFT